MTFWLFTFWFWGNIQLHEIENCKQHHEESLKLKQTIGMQQQNLETLLIHDSFISCVLFRLSLIWIYLKQRETSKQLRQHVVMFSLANELRERKKEEM